MTILSNARSRIARGGRTSKLNLPPPPALKGNGCVLLVGVVVDEEENRIALLQAIARELARIHRRAEENEVHGCSLGLGLWGGGLILQMTITAQDFENKA